MIEVIKERRNDINRRIICKNCESTIQFVYDDLTLEEERNGFDNTVDARKWIFVCPVCKEKITVKSEYFDYYWNMFDDSFGAESVDIPIN